MINDGKYSKNGFIGANSGSSAPNTSSSILNQYPIKSIINYSSEMNNSISRAKMNSNTTASSCSSNVKFSGLIFKEKIDDREKYLTAKYPNHQMALIKKRLKVEFWIDEQLKFLFDISDDDTKDDYDICADDLVDSLLDMDTDKEREYHILKQLTKAKKSKEEVYKFVNELLAKLRML
ncbi:phosphatase 1 regulatory subunit 14B [Brachionus plicatilis]|uniref:Phosphatase 1 regulatory subunit 14B n=1 Tax=Brachionus plicatilis TaxID=10195 RepID=A0A3M7QZW4_BRAPC|nr:phosphatase 1 regulatory subunit 14B [Brachionus plicatilis]